MFDAIIESVLPTVIAATSHVGNLSRHANFNSRLNFQEHPPEEPPMSKGYFFIIIPCVWAMISNFIVIVTIFRTPAILRSFAYVMISLSFVDLSSSLFVIPFSIYVFANNMHWGLGFPLCVWWTAVDVMLCTASICHHCAIALHRYLIISSPHDFSVTNNHKIIYRLIAPAWSVSAFIALILVVRSFIDSDLVYNAELDTCGINDQSYAIYSSIVSFFIPLSIIFAVSTRSICILQKRIDIKRKGQFGLISSARRRSMIITQRAQEEIQRQIVVQRQISGVRAHLARIYALVTGRTNQIITNEKADRKTGQKTRIIFSSRRVNAESQIYQPPKRQESNITIKRAFQNFAEKTFASYEEYIREHGNSRNIYYPTSYLKRVSSGFFSRASSEKHRLDPTKVAEKVSQQLQAESEDELSRLTEDIVEEFSMTLSRHNVECKWVDVLNIDNRILEPPTPTATPQLLKRSYLNNAPDIDSSRNSSVKGIHSTLFQSRPLTITEMSPPHRLLSVEKIPFPEVRQEARHHAPIAHMTSLEEFNTPSVACSPALLRHEFKRTLEPKVRVFSTDKSQIAKRVLSEPQSYFQLHRKIMETHDEVGHNAAQPEEASLVAPKTFYDMIRKKDLEREVEMAKRCKRPPQGSTKSMPTASKIRRKKQLRPQESSIGNQTLSRRIRKEKQAGTALLVVLVCFVLMWAPFFTLNIAYGICGTCVNAELFKIFTWTAWASCGVNPIIYTLCSRQFRQGLFRSLGDAINRMSVASIVNRHASDTLVTRLGSRRSQQLPK